MKVTSNYQSFQPIYIDSETKDIDDKIVLIEEMSESLPEATGVLNSLFKEKFYGMVAAGSTIALANFRAKLYDYDKVNKLGAMKIVDALKKIVDVCYECKCEMVYYKGPVFYEDLPNDLKNVSVAFDLKDVFTKGKEITKDVWTKLLAKDSGIEKQLGNMNTKEYKDLVKFLEKDEKSYKELQKALKNSDKIDTNNLLNEMLHEIDVDDDLEEYLGKNYINLFFYIVKKDVLDVGYVYDELADMYSWVPELDQKRIVVPKKDATKEERLKIEKNNEKIKSQDEHVRKKMIEAEENVVAIGLDDLNKRFIVAVKKPISGEILNRNADWPKKPSNVKAEDLKRCIWNNDGFELDKKNLQG